MDTLLIDINEKISDIEKRDDSNKKFINFYNKSFKNDFFDFDYLKNNYDDSLFEEFYDEETKNEIEKILYSINTLSQNGLLNIIQYEELKEKMKNILEEIYNNLPLIDKKRKKFLNDLKNSIIDYINGIKFENINNLLRYFDEININKEEKLRIIKDLVIGNINIIKKSKIQNNYIDSNGINKKVVNL